MYCVPGARSCGKVWLVIAVINICLWMLWTPKCSPCMSFCFLFFVFVDQFQQLHFSLFSGLIEANVFVLLWVWWGVLWFPLPARWKEASWRFELVHSVWNSSPQSRRVHSCGVCFLATWFFRVFTVSGIFRITTQGSIRCGFKNKVSQEN